MDRTSATQLLFLACSVILIHHSCSKDCSVNVNSADFPSPQPLVLKVGADRDSSSFVVPDAGGNITVAADADLLLACPDSRFKLADAQKLQVKCVSDTVFSVDGTPYTFNLLACQQLPKASAKDSTQKCTDDANHKMVSIGFYVEKEFYKLYDVCFDANELTPLYTNATVKAGIKGFQVSFPRPDKWEAGGLYGSVDMANQYRTQTSTLVKLLGDLPANISNNMLTRGHLAAKADFGLGVQQSATFYYANSAPQWYAFNGGNWNQLELDVRDFASANKFDLQVYTGTYGKLKLANKAGNLTEIYLYVSSSKKKVPVPMLFWKIVFEPKSEQGIVFVGVNNPYYSSSKLPAEYKICPDVCSRIKWLNWKPKNQTSGLTYCCEYASFRTKVPYSPYLPVTKTFSSSGAEAASALTLATVLCSVWLLVRNSYD